MSHAGHSVLVLERDRAYRDCVRGENILPWGVREANRLALTDTLTGPGSHWTTRWVSYNETLTAAEAEERALALDRLLPNVPGSLNQQHPVSCQKLRDAAIESGARYTHGVRSARVEPGVTPAVTYTVDGVEHRARCRLVAGADGRHSAVRARLTRATRGHDRHLVAGLLVEDLDGVWEAADVQTVEDRVFFLGLPQGDGRARVYLAFEHEDRAKFEGPGRDRAFLDACRRRTLPQGEIWASGRPAGPCGIFTGEDLVTESPVGPGVVLIGDAAGYISPLVGQGLSMALRDVRVVTELLRASHDWSEAALRPFVVERAERMRRLRAITDLYSAVFADFSPGIAQRRLRVAERMESEATLALPFAAVFAGPELVPSAGFVNQVRERLLAPEEVSKVEVRP